MFYLLLIMLCKFINKKYIKSHDMRKNMVSERGGGADKKTKKKKKKNNKENPNLVRILYMVCALNDIYKQYNKLHEH